MGIIESNKTIDKTIAKCGDELKITIALTASPNIINNPTDIVLLLDKSGSMSGNPLNDMKEAAKTFVKIIEEATNDYNGNISSGSGIGIISFATHANVDQEITTSVSNLNDTIDQINAGGNYVLRKN